MNKPLGIALLVGGIILLVLGFNESQSFSSDVSRVFTNAPTDRSVWMLVAGGIAAAAGLFMVMGRSRS